MKRFFKLFTVSALAIVLSLVGCKKDDEQVPVTTGTLSGTITDNSDGSGLADAQIIVFDANTNTPSGGTVTSGEDGTYSTELDPGSYFIKVSKQGYNNVPVAGVSAIPFEIVVGDTQTKDVPMFESTITNAGFITGTVTDGTNAVAGTLIVAASGQVGYSTVSDENGNYSIFNIPASEYNVQAWISGYNSDIVTATVTSGAESAGNNITLTEGAGGSVSGSVTIRAFAGGDVDVSLTHPITKESIPGLNTTTTTLNYTIENVPNGEYLARASFENDLMVMDPDWIIKFGEPYVTVADAAITIDFTITGAVQLVAPTNAATSNEPVVTAAVPVFEWTAYAQTTDYIIEVSDANGNLVWGGFTPNYAAKNIVIPKGVMSITFGDTTYGSAPLADLESGKVYRWRVYSSTDVASTGSWKLLSVSEDQQGLIIIE